MIVELRLLVFERLSVVGDREDTERVKRQGMAFLTQTAGAWDAQGTWHRWGTAMAHLDLESLVAVPIPQVWLPGVNKAKAMLIPVVGHKLRRVIQPDKHPAPPLLRLPCKW